MAKYDDDQNIREIESRIDIVELISETVQLSRKGNNYWGLCPFHQEKTASFSVSRDKQMYYCFGCHAGGNIFSFIMKKDGLDFKEALEVLAAKAGVEIKRNLDRKVIDKRKQIIAVNNAAAQFYHSLLSGDRGREARDYLEKRGIFRETMETFQLGYAPDEWSRLQDYLLKKGFAAETLKAAGLIRRSENQNRFYDLFRHRIIFPIVQTQMDVVGFGGRSMGDSHPKYLNTAETDLFSKRKNLYGLAQARENIREKNSAILVEGYMDCIKMQQTGIKNVVASLGTALTEDQARLLRRYTEKAVILYDGDEAGQRETLRAITVLKEADVKVEVISLPPGKDPDEYIDYYGKEGFWQYITNNGYSDIEFKLNRYLSAAVVLDLDAKINIINLLKQDISSLSSALEKDHYLKMLARKLRVEENLVSQEVQKGYNYKSGRQDRNNIEIIWDNYRYGNYGIQEKILAAMLKNETVFNKIKRRIGINFFANPNYRTLVAKFDKLQGDHTKRMKEMIHIASNEGLESDYARIAMLIDKHNPDEAREVEEFIIRVEQKKAEHQWQKAFAQLKTLDDSGDFDSVLDYILKLDKLSEAAREGGIL
ncbi:MAG: DNA primase [Syntrophomonadaceae bacterium]|nr:DNA primase [Syntrophomonadaceae bacterium]